MTIALGCPESRASRALQVPDFAALDQLAANLDAAGVRHDDVVEEPHGARYICFYDPDGIPWELYAMPSG